jgi:hypothetical protein
MPTYKQLNQRHPSFDELDDKTLFALYEGGKRLEGCIGELLPQRQAEHAERYRLRKKEAGYRNYVGPVVDFFTSMLFATQPSLAAKDSKGELVLETDDFYGRFQDDCDRNGSDFDDVLKDGLTHALVGGRSWFWVRQPSKDHTADSMQSFREQKLGECWIESIANCDVLDWDTDETGALTIAILRRVESKRESIGSSRDEVVETWFALFPDRVETYAVRYERGGRPDADKEVPLISTEPHGFGKVPLVCLGLHPGLHVVGRLKSAQIAHFRKNNALAWSLSATCYAQPVFKLKDQDSPPIMGAGYGIIIGAEESVEWASPPTDHFTALAAEVKTEKDEIFRVAQQMALGVENNAAAIGRSGDSKAQDAQNTRVVLLAFSRVVKEAAKKILDMIAVQRGEDIAWTVGGLDDFASADLSGLLSVLESVDKIGGVPSHTFNVEMKKRLAETLIPDLDQAMKVKIGQEIESGITEAEAQKKEMFDAAKKGAENPEPNGSIGKFNNRSSSKPDDQSRPAA